MSTAATALALQRLKQESPALLLLRQDMLPVVAAVLLERLANAESPVPAADLYEALELDFAELRQAGFTIERTAQSYCTDWVKGGILQRLPAPVGRGEVFLLSPASHDALLFLSRLTEPRPGVTGSKLTMIVNELQRLATNTDDSIPSRLRVLETEKERIQRQIDATARGEHVPTEPEAALRHLEEIVRHAREVPAEFARVRQAMDQLNRQLRRDLIEDSAPQGDVLEDVFLGVDRIRSSPEGKSFTAFYSLLMDPETTALLHGAVEAITQRSFVNDVSPATLYFLRDYLYYLQDASRDVSNTMGNFSRSLRQFVQSRQFEEFRELAHRLRLAGRASLEAVGAIRLTDHMDFQLELTKADFRSVGVLAPHVPSEVEVTEAVQTHSTTELDWEALRAQVRESEIDFHELRASVDAALKTYGAVTVGQVLEHFPATQGLASAVGLLVLGSRFGRPLQQEETVRWETHGQAVAATLSHTYRFEESLNERE